MKDVRGSLERILGPAGVLAGEPPVAVPANDEEAIEAIRLAAKERWTLSPIGLGPGNPSGVDFLLSTRRITGVVAYEPGDGTITARAGTTMAELDRVAREGGNHLTPRVAAPDCSTLGGVLAEGRSGIDRLRYGPARHHVLGMRVAFADGSVARSGGRLVKNVTGYDLHRLFCGSRGSLCVVLEASMRLFAGFEREELLTATARDLAGALEAARAAADLGVRPLAIRAENVLDPGSRWRVHVLLAGRSDLVDWGRRTILSTWPGAAAGSESIDRLRDAEGDARRVTERPSRLAVRLRQLPEGSRMVIDPDVGCAWIFDRTPEELGAARAPGAGAALSARLKQAFDPDGILAPI